jgi:hypothetical protein
MALGLLFLATSLDPVNIAVNRWRNRASRLAGPVAFGFLLLIPLQLFALMQASSRLDLRQQLQRQSAEERLAAIERAIHSARSSSELNQHLQALQAPPLPEAEQGLPLSQLRPLLLQRLTQTQGLVQRSLARPVQIPLPTRLLQAIRGVLSNLAYGLAFAACAFGPNQRRSLLNELLAAPHPLQKLWPKRRKQRDIWLNPIP